MPCLLGLSVEARHGLASPKREPPGCPQVPSAPLLAGVSGLRPVPRLFRTGLCACHPRGRGATARGKLVWNQNPRLWTGRPSRCPLCGQPRCCLERGMKPATPRALQGGGGRRDPPSPPPAGWELCVSCALPRDHRGGQAGGGVAPEKSDPQLMGPLSCGLRLQPRAMPEAGTCLLCVAASLCVELGLDSDPALCPARRSRCLPTSAPAWWPRAMTEG